jgi:L-malate glycosyltransferase
MVGRNPGYVTTQGEILSDHFEESGYRVISVSSSPNRYIRLADIITTLIRYRHSIDILMLQVYSGRSFIVEDIASWLGQRFKHRIVMVLRGGYMPEFMSRFPAWTQRVLGRAHALIAPSEFLARAIIPYGFRAKVIPNLLNFPVYPYRHRQMVQPHLFWMRSFYPYYNPAMAIRALALLRSKVPKATLVMAGPDLGIEANVRKLVKELGLDGAVSFPGFLDMESKIRIGNSTDIFLNTNNIDNMPVAVLEACAMGLPVVATSVGGIPDLLTDEETALLVPDNDVEAMVDAIYRLLNEPGLSGLLSANGRQLAERASWQSIHSLWKEVFAEIMES